MRTSTGGMPSESGLCWISSPKGLSPSNNPVLNPLGWKALIDTGGLSAVRGLRHFVGDMRSAPRVPSMVEPDAFTLGETIAVTAGSVVFRCEEFELIQYAPQTDKVCSVPLLMVPPVINKFYIMDISPGRSMIEYFLRQGIQVFAISWRNPTAEHRNWGFDTYGQAILNALDAVEKITAVDRTHLQASCSGGILAAMMAAHLTATGEGQRLAGSDPDGDGARPERRPVSLRPPSTRRPRTSRSRCRPARAIWTAARWRRCSPGCVRPTWSGGTG